MEQNEVAGQMSLYKNAGKKHILPVDSLLQQVIAQAKKLGIPVSERYFAACADQ